MHERQCSSVVVVNYTPNPVEHVSRIARTCYQSEQPDSYEEHEKLVRRLIDRGHTAMIEFASITFCIITDRGITHELVRHRIASFAQESTRYCNYKNKQMSFIKPKQDLSPAAYRIWKNHMIASEHAYKMMLDVGETPQIARSVLPTSLKAEINFHVNMRSFRNFLGLRTATDAHPMMVDVARRCALLAFNCGFGPFIDDIVTLDWCERDGGVQCS
mgnify:CR=1 FL=1